MCCVRVFEQKRKLLLLYVAMYKKEKGETPAHTNFRICKHYRVRERGMKRERVRAGASGRTAKKSASVFFPGFMSFCFRWEWMCVGMCATFHM